MKANKQITIQQLCEKTQMSESGVKKVIRKLKNKGMLEHLGGKRGDDWKVILK